MYQKTALISGASRGIGKAIALRFAAKGYRIVVNCRQRADLLSATKREVEDRGVPCLSFVGDLGDFQTASRMFREAEAFAGGIDVLVNNAGVSHVGLLTDLTVEEWDGLVRSNLSSAFYCCKLAIPYMVRRKAGKIIQISSVWGDSGASCEAAYSATKGGLNAMTKSLAKELGPSNVQVNAIACGFIDTDMNASLSKQETKDLLNEIPMARAGTPEEVARLACFLAGDNPYLTGQVVALDGGWR